MAASRRQCAVAAFPVVAQVNPDAPLEPPLLVDFTSQLPPGPRQIPAAPSSAGKTPPAVLAHPVGVAYCPAPPWLRGRADAGGGGEGRVTSGVKNSAGSDSAIHASALAVTDH